MNDSWLNTDPPVDASVIRSIGIRLGVDLPNDFVEFAKIFHGGQPRIGCFDYTDDSGPSQSGLEILWSFVLEREWNFLSVNERQPVEMPAGLIIFGEDGGGGCICFDYRKAGTYPPIVFWSNDTESAETVAPLAATFAEFIANLKDDSSPITGGISA